ncbi:MAG: hypothetical protein J3K34DRAFT_527256, partial [Monoraphidium minutum]
MTLRRVALITTLLALLQCSAASAPGSSAHAPPRTCRMAPALYGPTPADPYFPSGGELVPITGDELNALLLRQARGADLRRQLVVFFHLEACPNSIAMKPVVECLPAFFPPEVLFVSVEYSDLSLLQLMTNTLHALPVLQVSVKGKRYRYRGRHALEPLLAFLARALNREPLAPPSAARLCAARPGACGGWRCGRVDGEATVEELTARPPPMLHLSLLFLAARACMWCWRRRRRPAAQGGGGGGGGGAPPAAQAAAAG